MSFQKYIVKHVCWNNISHEHQWNTRFFLLLKNQIFIARSEDIYAICQPRGPYGEKQWPRSRNFQARGQSFTPYGPILSRQITFFSWSKGVFTWHRGDFRPGASSLRFPLMALYLFTWYHHKILCRRESPRREFSSVLAPGREFYSGTKSRNGIM